MPTKFLSHADLATAVRLTPLVAIDRIIRNGRDEVLLGLRNNEPAKGCYFVSGGIVLKNGRLAEAFTRLVKSETDHTLLSRTRGCSARSSTSMTLIVPATPATARITWYSAINSNGQMPPYRKPTTSTANCAGGLWPSCWHRIVCMKTRRPISGRNRDMQKTVLGAPGKTH